VGLAVRISDEGPQASCCDLLNPDEFFETLDTSSPLVGGPEPLPLLAAPWRWVLGGAVAVALAGGFGLYRRRASTQPIP
jgi:hypothetical protein